jgi:hypothetical protein
MQAQGKRLLLGVIAMTVATTAAGCPSEYEIKDPDAVESCDEPCAELENTLLAGCTVVSCVESDTGGVWIAPTDDSTCRAEIACPDDPYDPDNPDASCYDLYVACFEATGDAAGCNDDYADCLEDNSCTSQYNECMSDAYDELQTCLADPNHNDDWCEWYYEYCSTALCDCELDGCLDDTDPSCECQFSMLVSPPIVTGPARWTVERAYIDQQIDRLAALDTETAIWGIPNANRQLAGIQLGSIEADEPLYALGLRNGDIVVSVNSQAIRVALQHPQQLVALRNTETIYVGVRRGTVLRQHRYDLVD